MVKKFIKIIILCIWFILISETSFAVDVFVGITAQQSTLFISEEDSQKDLAEMENDLYFTPAFAIRSENNYFHQDSNWGYFLEFNGGLYNVNRQVVNDDTVNLNTELKGFYWDLTPTIFYNLGNKTRDSLALKMGLGVGIGFLSVSGNVILTEQILQDTVKYNDNNYGFTVGIFCETTLNSWFLQIKGYGPYIVVDDKDLFLANIKMTLGRMIKL